jgi:plasmid stability protein
MTDMATLYIRDVPETIVTHLKRRAKHGGRSLNSEVVARLEASVAEERTLEEVLDAIEALAKRINLSPDAPMPEELIRLDRDSR